MTVQRSPQVRLYPDDMSLKELLVALYRNFVWFYGVGFVGVIGAGVIGFLLASEGNQSQIATANENARKAEENLKLCQTETANAKTKAEADLAELKSKSESDLKALKSKYDFDLVYYDSQVKKYLAMMGKSPESRKRETFLNLLISYQTTSEIAKNSPLPMTANEKQNSIASLQNFISDNLDMSQESQNQLGLIFVIEPKDQGFNLSVDCGGVLRFIPTEISDPLTEKLKKAFEKQKKAALAKG